MMISVRLLKTIRRSDQKLVVREGAIGTTDREVFENGRGISVSVMLPGHERRNRIPRAELVAVRFGLWDTENLCMIGFEDGMTWGSKTDAMCYLDPDQPHIIVAPIPPCPARAPTRRLPDRSIRVWTRRELLALPYTSGDGEQSLLRVAKSYDIPQASAPSLIKSILRAQDDAA